MSLRLGAWAAALSLVAGCAVPRTSIALGAVTAFVTTGSVLLVAGALLMLVGVVSLGGEHDSAVPTGLAEDEPLARSSSAPPGSARAALQGRVAQLAFELRVEARAGHCAAASALGLRLDRLDHAQLVALVEDDRAIAACIEVRP